MHQQIDLVRTLRDENEELREQVRQMKAALVPPFLYPAEWRLTAAETIILSVLLARPIAPRRAIVTALRTRPIGRGGQVRPDDADSMPSIDTLIWKLRQKLNPLGCQIEAVYGVGWRLDQDGRQKLQEKVEQVA